MKKFFLLFALTLALTFAATTLKADPPGPPGPGGPPGGTGGVPVGSPVDGGISLLLALGLGYGGYRLSGKKPGNKTEEEDVK
jgi:hypothetical protein